MKTLNILALLICLSLTQLFASSAAANDELKLPKAQKWTFASIVVGIVTGPMCFDRTSATIFMGGAIALLVKEQKVHKKYQEKVKEHQSNIEQLQNADDFDQKATQTITAVHLRNTAEIIQNKIDHTKDIATVYGVAAAFAASEGFTLTGGLCGALVNIQDQNIQRMANLPAIYQLYQQRLDRSSLAQELASASDYERFLHGKLQSLSIAEYEENYSPFETLLSVSQQRFLSDAFNQLSNLVIPTAYALGADDAEILTSAGVNGALKEIKNDLVALSPAWLTTILANGFSRSATFFAFMDQLKKAARELEDARLELLNRAGQYEYLATLYDGGGNTPNINNDDPSSGGGPGGSGHSPGTRPTVTQNASGPCVSGPLGQQNLDPSCSCQATNSCTTVSAPKSNEGKTVGGSAGLPLVFAQNVGGLLSGINDVLSGKATQGAISGSFPDVQKAISDAREKMVSQLREKEKKEKVKNPMDIEAEGKKLSEQILADVEKSTQKLSSSQLASLFGSSQFNQLAAREKEEKVEAFVASVAGAGADATVKAAKEEEKKDEDKEKATRLANGERENLIAQQSDLLDQYVSNESDINRKPEMSLFQIITHRYIKSGYDRLMEKKNLAP